MTGDVERPESSDGEGVRRRRSTEHHDALVLDVASDGVQTGTHTLAASDHPPQYHVCLSSDSERPHEVEKAKAKKRKSDEMLRDTDGANENPAASLAVDTRAAAIMGGGEVSGGPIVGLPTSMMSPKSGHTSWHTAPLSPMTPRGRSRGMSLRSSLFTRHLDQRVRSGGASAIELQTVRSSSGAKALPPISDMKKISRPSVTVTPVGQRAPSPPLPPLPTSRKGVQGLSALPNYQQWVQRKANRHLPIKRVKAVLDKARKCILRIQDIPPSKDGRHIALDPSRKKELIDGRTDKPFIGNSIRSSRYTAWNFLPRQLFAQFSKLANFYFLCVSILQMIPGLSTTGTYTTIVPLLFFVSVSMAKEGHDDLRRYRLDKAENNRQAEVMHAYRPVEGQEDLGDGRPDGPIHWAPVKWHSLQVGDVVKLKRDEAAPADLLLLRSTGANNIAYVETMALDGETNLKNKQPPSALVAEYSSTESIAAAGGAHFVVEDPNLDLYNLKGKVTTPAGKTGPLTNNEIIYRGSVLRNTPEAIGIVIYSGDECKIRMNANKNPRIKAPSLQAIVNKVVILIVFFVVFLALFNTIA